MTLSHSKTKTGNGEKSCWILSDTEPSRPFWQVLLLGLAAGSAGSLIGVGGGIVMVPILTMWGFTQRKSQGTSLIVIAAMSPVAIITYYLLGNINLNFALPLAIGGVIGSFAGSAIAQKISNALLKRLFGAFLILIAIKMIFLKLGDPEEILESAAYVIEAGLMGIVAGICAGFFGVGGGVVFVPAGVLIANLAQAVAQGSSFTAILPTTMMGSMIYIRNREIIFSYLKCLIPGAIVGAVAGSWVADLIPGTQLRFIFALYLLYTGFKRLLSGNENRKP